jgi:hypothetical protein
MMESQVATWFCVRESRLLMICPFPGMDPYIERPAIWADFHDCLIVAIRTAIQPMLRPKYAALVQDRLYVVQSQRPIRPDVALVETTAPQRGATFAVAQMELDQPMVYEVSYEEIREPYIEIIEPAGGNRLITAIEVLSPDNKVPGAGRKQYLKKRKEFRSAHANLVEIDLLRSGKPTVRVGAAELAALQPWRYLAAVTRWPNREEVYAVALQNRLPRLAIPLTAEDQDVRLDLQAVFTRCWEEGPYPELLRYDGPPPGEMTPEETAWCDERLRLAGFRPAAAGA